MINKSNIISKIKEWQCIASEVDITKLFEDIDDIFISSCSLKHYIGIVPINLDDYFKEDEQNSLLHQGYYRDGSPIRFYNGLFVPECNIEKLIAEIQKREFVVEKVQVSENFFNYIVTLNGIDNSHYIEDMAKAQQAE